MRLWLERAWVDGATRDGVLVDVDGGRFVRVQPDADPGDAERVAGLTLPGLANCHSHAFHRALRGRTQRERGTFWTWREQMYAVAGRLDPDSYHRLARAVFREMVATGITSVGEFHYLHHGPDGTPYDDRNAMGHALVAAAEDARIRLSLLDACYLTAGMFREPQGVQVRFSDGDVDAWAERVEALHAAVGAHPEGSVVVGAAVHSVRAVPAGDIPVVAGWAERHHAPLHVHLSEQVAENDASRQAYGRTPTRVLADAGALGSRTSAVHATHLTPEDVAMLGGSSTYACFCPTTERDLGDGIGPSRALSTAGARLTLGSDSHAVVDLFEEMRAVELDERLASQERGHWSAAELLAAATHDGHRSLGIPDAGVIAVGARAALVTLDPAAVGTAGPGAAEGTAVFAAGGADVVRVVSDGRLVADAGSAADAGAELDKVLRELWAQ
ncbi:MAG: formimidoylglutamate deiminase [Nocardioidaceae bacterium]